jgi:hypothetical protein
MYFTVIKIFKKWNTIKLNPPNPNMRGKIEPHKSNNPIRKNVNCQNAAAYKKLNISLNTLQQFVQPLHYILDIETSKALGEDTHSSTISTRVSGHQWHVQYT